MSQTPKTTPAAPSPEPASKPSEPPASSARTREELMKLLASNPRFRIAPKSGKAFVIGGVRAETLSSKNQEL
jgi:hypothetical protein